MEYQSTKEERFDSIYRAYVEDVYRACLYMTKNEDLSQEMTQQAFVNYYERFEVTKPECVKAYLIQSAKNLIKNYYRDNKKIVENDENGDLPFATEMVTGSVEEQCIEEETRELRQKLTVEILTDLKENHEIWYEILYMLYFRDMSYEDITEELNVSKDALYSRIRRAKVWIQKNYQVKFDDLQKEIS